MLYLEHLHFLNFSFFNFLVNYSRGKLLLLLCCGEHGLTPLLLLLLLPLSVWVGRSIWRAWEDGEEVVVKPFFLQPFILAFLYLCSLGNGLLFRCLVSSISFSFWAHSYAQFYCGARMTYGRLANRVSNTKCCEAPCDSP